MTKPQGSMLSLAQAKETEASHNSLFLFLSLFDLCASDTTSLSFSVFPNLVHCCNDANAHTRRHACTHPPTHPPTQRGFQFHYSSGCLIYCMISLLNTSCVLLESSAALCRFTPSHSRCEFCTHTHTHTGTRTLQHTQREFTS